MWFSKVWTVFEFEFRRTLTWRRALAAFALAMFPVFLICLMQFQGAHLERGDRALLCLFFLIPVVLCVIGQLLWATGIIQTELEEKTWTYLSVRPLGGGAIVTGKYLAAVAWSTICAATSLTLSMAVLAACGASLTPGPALAALAFLSTAAYGAVFVLLGVLFPSRAMVAAVAYTAVMEAVVAWLPAAVNRISILYHLRCLFARWLLDSGIHGPDFDAYFFDTASAGQHLVLLTGITLALLTAAALVLRRRQIILLTDA